MVPCSSLSDGSMEYEVSPVLDQIYAWSSPAFLEMTSIFFETMKAE